MSLRDDEFREHPGLEAVQDLLEMGERFCETAEQSARLESRDKSELVFQHVHWGLELVLKAYLHSRGWTDARCAIEIGHDLVKALAACEHCGLQGVTQEERSFLAALSPYSRVHRVNEFVRSGAAGVSAATAMAHGASLSRAIRRAIA